jgi:hypothetical protein
MAYPESGARKVHEHPAWLKRECGGGVNRAEGGSTDFPPPDQNAGEGRLRDMMGEATDEASGQMSAQHNRMTPLESLRSTKGSAATEADIMKQVGPEKGD